MLYDHDFESLYVAHRMTKRIADAALEYLARRCPDLRSPTADRALNDFRLSVVAVGSKIPKKPRSRRPVQLCGLSND